MGIEDFVAAARKIAGGEEGPLNLKLGALEQSGSREEADALRNDLARLAELNKIIREETSLLGEGINADGPRVIKIQEAEEEKAAILTKHKE